MVICTYDHVEKSYDTINTVNSQVTKETIQFLNVHKVHYYAYTPMKMISLLILTLKIFMVHIITNIAPKKNHFCATKID